MCSDHVFTQFRSWWFAFCLRNYFGFRTSASFRVIRSSHSCRPTGRSSLSPSVSLALPYNQVSSLPISYLLLSPLFFSSSSLLSHLSSSSDPSMSCFLPLFHPLMFSITSHALPLPEKPLRLTWDYERLGFNGYVKEKKKKSSIKSRMICPDLKAEGGEMNEGGERGREPIPAS